MSQPAALVDDGVVDEELKWSRLLREVSSLLRSQDAKEGPLAFAVKRQPVWKAR